jgi:PadR family transcriptional regulator, regulatory protein PadR
MVNDLQAAILSALAGERSHGYAILQAVAESTGRQPAVATVYATLENLVARGLLVEAGDEIVKGRARRYFDLAPAGLAELERWVDAHERETRIARHRIESRRVAGREVTA